jgi:hypothetical protein
MGLGHNHTTTWIIVKEKITKNVHKSCPECPELVACQKNMIHQFIATAQAAGISGVSNRNPTTPVGTTTPDT